MRAVYVSAMDKLYLLCAGIAVVSVVCMTVLIFVGVVMRYVFLMGAQFAEPLSIFFAVQLTMYGAAACFRSRSHLSLELFVSMLSPKRRRVADWMALALVAALAVFMVVYGVSLTETTWFQAYPEFRHIRVGFVYSAIPGSGLVTLLFVIEAAFFRSGDPRDGDESLRRVLEHGQEEAQKLSLRME